MKNFNPREDFCALARACTDLLNTTALIARAEAFDVINLMDIRHRTEMARSIVELRFNDDDHQAIDKLVNGRQKWHVFRNLPFDGQRDTVATTMMGVIAAARARPFAFLEGDGAVDRVVKPKKGREDDVTTSGRRTFGPHVDHAWGDFSFERQKNGTVTIPDYVALGGVTNPNRVGTLFCDPLDVISHLSELTQYQLEKEQWSFPAPPSVTPPKISHKRAIIVRDRNHLPVIRLNPRIISESQAAANALAELLDVLSNRDLWTEVVLEPGQMVLASGTALHMRGEVNGDRELVAIYGRFPTTVCNTVAEQHSHLERVD